jgi:hypothetical protein
MSRSSHRVHLRVLRGNWEKKQPFDLRSSRMLRSAYWNLAADVSGQPIVPFLMGQAGPNP